MAAPSCAYPLFRERFWQREPLADGNAPPAPPGGPHCAPAASTAAAGGGRDPALSPTKAASRMGTLRMLDLRALPRDDGPPTELRARKEKLAHFERQCTRVAEGLYVGAEAVARCRGTLAEAGITHVVNCVGFLYPAHFDSELAYQTLYLQDTPGEDILCVLYDVFDFIEEATGGAAGGASGTAPGRVLVHCSQGVSRSATLAIAYLMWKRAAGYDDVFQEVKAARGVANPNIGFICQLLQWQKRRHTADAWRLYRIAPQSHSAPQYLVAKPVGGLSPRGAAAGSAAAGPAACLDPRGAFMLQGPDSLTIWEGAACPEAFVAAAQRFAAQLHKYEAAPAPPELVRQGQEPPSFWASLVQAAAGGDGGGSRSGSPAAPGTAVASVAAAAAELLAGAAGGEPVAVAENSCYDKDFELYHRSLTSRTSGDSHGGDSARSGGRKTPREEGDTATSPNDRLRKQARGEERPPSPGKRRREPPADLTLEDLQCVSMDSAAAQLGKKERTLQEATSPPPLGRTISDLLPSSDMELADGSATPRSRGSEQAVAAAWERHQQQRAPQHPRDSRGRPRQLSNLGRQVSTASSAAAAAATAAGAAAPPPAAAGQGGGGGRRVPPLRLGLPLPDRQ
ncbi:hypothetical protein ABPG75_005891 [Micractinium tetrahymenae]